ncbi:alpha/beta hydrolase family protein [Pseudomonas viridiflava]|uniref:alpha/beta hydrolase family protein n=1 Tax=Pseudomonas viridiflava TaxID=33069 RepID=UPI000F023086|nr:alpha/beta hydrolase [Pseudomonas viridiflava]
MSNQDESTARQDGPFTHSRRQMLQVGASLAALPLLAAASSAAQATGSRVPTSDSPAPVTDTNSDAFIDGLADLMAYSTRTPILRWPDQYGMEYEEIFFPAIDGITIEGWFIPANSDRLLIMNHPMPCNRYGYPGHMDPWKNFGGFEVNFLPEYKILHDAGYNIITYDMRNHGRSGTGSGGVNGHGVLEYRDVMGSLNYARSRPDTKSMKTALYSRCLGANSTIVAMHKHPKEFGDIKAMIALQPSLPGVFVGKAAENLKIINGYNRLDAAFFKRTGYHFTDAWPMEYSRSVTVPTLVAQVRQDASTRVSSVQEIHDLLSSTDKKMFWIEGTDQRFEGYNYFGRNPQVVLDWLASHMGTA